MKLQMRLKHYKTIATTRPMPHLCIMYFSLSESTAESESMKSDFEALEKRFNSEVESLTATIEHYEAERQEDKEKLKLELSEIIRRQNDTQRQLTKLCLVFTGPAVSGLLARHHSDNIFYPMIDLMEKRYNVPIKDFEISDIHPVQTHSKHQSVIVRFNSRHDRSAYA